MTLGGGGERNHAVVLYKMEEDRHNWAETNKNDRI